MIVIRELPALQTAEWMRDSMQNGVSLTFSKIVEKKWVWENSYFLTCVNEDIDEALLLSFRYGGVVSAAEADEWIFSLAIKFNAHQMAWKSTSMRCAMGSLTFQKSCALPGRMSSRLPWWMFCRIWAMKSCVPMYGVQVGMFSRLNTKHRSKRLSKLRKATGVCTVVSRAIPHKQGDKVQCAQKSLK